MTTFTIKQALATTPEQLATMTLEDVQAVADTLATSTDKRASRKLDLVQGTLNARKQEAKKSGDKEAEQEVKAVENSVKKVARARKPKVKAPEQEALPLDDVQEEPEQEEQEEPKKKVAPKKKPTPKAKKAEQEETEQEEEAPKKKAPTPKKGATKEPDEVAKLKAQLAQLEQENSKLKAEVFPAKIERKGKDPLVAQKLPTVQDVQKVLMSRPYELFLYVHEGLDDKPTAFTVLYMNDEILVLLDRSREQNTTLTLKVKNMKAKSVKIDNRECPFIFYLSEKQD